MGTNLLTAADKIRIDRLLNYDADRYNQEEIQSEFLIVDD